MSEKVSSIPAIFEDAALLTMWCESPLHPGVGMVGGLVDLPIYREEVTGLPAIPSSSIKGVLRSIAKVSWKENENEVEAVFGPPPEKGAEFAGSVSITDATLLLFPASCVRGLFCWLTSPLQVARLERALNYIGKGLNIKVAELEVPKDGALVPLGSENPVLVKGESRLILLDGAYNLRASGSKQMHVFAEDLLNYLPLNGKVGEFIKMLLKRRIAVVSDDTLREITRRGAIVVTRIRLEEDKKVVARGALWDEECMPPGTIFFSTIFGTKKPRSEVNIRPLEKLRDLIKKGPLGIFGGDETIGRGIVRMGVTGNEQ